MEIKREVTIKLTDKEAAEIIKNYLNQKHSDMEITSIHFNVTTAYSSPYDERDGGTKVMNEVRCSGTLKEK